MKRVVVRILARVLLGALSIVVTKPLLAGTEQPASLPVTLGLMPVPKSIQLGSGQFALDGPLTFAYTSFHDGRLERAVDRFEHQIAFETGQDMSHAPAKNPALANLVIDVQGPGERIQSIDEDESYSLKVDARQIHLRAATVVGAMRGLETLFQLVAPSHDQYVLPAVNIEDAPRFHWRSLMLDCAKHFEPLPVILRTLDGMAAVKLNVLHLHLSDNEAERVESKSFPKLHELGSADGLYYTQDQVRQVIAYARDRGIRVVPEFDMPGHFWAWLVGYPELASSPGPYVPQTDSLKYDDTALDPTRESTYRFLDTFIGEMAALFPDAYFHVGGDESRGTQWLANPRITSFMTTHSLKTAAALQTYFESRLLKIVAKHGKHMVGWEEILHSDFSGEQALNPLPKEVVVEPWHNPDLLLEGARHGYPMIMSAPYYLNRMYSAEQHYSADPEHPDTLSQGLWVGSFEEKNYIADRKDQATGLSPEQHANILGGEVCMWGKYIEPDTVDSIMWPRLAAIAERFWSSEDVRDVNDMYRRLQIESLRLDRLGVTHISGPQEILRNLAGQENPAALNELASVLEPMRLRVPAFDDVLKPLNRMMDAVVPDPPSRHSIAIEVDALLSDPQDDTPRAQLAARFYKWQQLPTSLDALMRQSPRMEDAAPRVAQLRQLGALGLAALDCLKKGQPPATDWQQKGLALLTDADQPIGQVRFAFLPSLRRMVLACNGGPKR